MFMRSFYTEMYHIYLSSSSAEASAELILKDCQLGARRPGDQRILIMIIFLLKENKSLPFNKYRIGVDSYVFMPWFSSILRSYRHRSRRYSQ